MYMITAKIINNTLVHRICQTEFVSETKQANQTQACMFIGKERHVYKAHYCKQFWLLSALEDLRTNWKFDLVVASHKFILARHINWSVLPTDVKIWLF